MRCDACVLWDYRESRQDRYTVKADVFSLGCVFYTLVTGMVPFAGLQANDEMAEDAERMRGKLDKIEDRGAFGFLSRRTDRKAASEECKLV